ncbi:protein of unknown function [Nitrospira japonica]|uniref:Uncharacterized protein n=1 Tax=Nitrospira japonica TaxID=1325564 RepID=A0A1W1I195_9BACT|nr:protein of unknown function [Nitrospira japonica]
MRTISEPRSQHKPALLSDRFTAMLPKLIEFLEQEYRNMPRPPASPSHPHRSLLAAAHHSLAALSELQEATK